MLILESGSLRLTMVVPQDDPEALLLEAEISHVNKLVCSKEGRFGGI